MTTVLIRDGNLATRSSRPAESGECGDCLFETLTACLSSLRPLIPGLSDPSRTHHRASPLRLVPGPQRARAVADRLGSLLVAGVLRSGSRKAGRSQEVNTAPVNGFVGLLVGLLGGIVAVLIIARWKAHLARGLAAQIIADAHREAETISRQADLATKEEALRRREEIETEADTMRREMREQEKRQEKRADLLDQKLDLINRKEREFESIQRQIAEQQDELRTQNVQVRRVLADQVEALHRISRLSPDEAQ